MINSRNELRKVVAWMNEINFQYDRAKWFKEKYNLENYSLDVEYMWEVTEFAIMVRGIRVNLSIWLDEDECPRETSFDNGWECVEEWEFLFIDYPNAKELIEAAEQEINNCVNEIKR